MRIKHLFRLAAVLLSMCVSGSAQTTFATITGTVKDASGSAVPGAGVTATEVNTIVSTSTKSNEVGNYTIAQLKDGTYTVTAQAAGFKGFVVSNVVLTSRDVRRIDIDFEVGSVGASIEVHSGATLIETETARIANTKDALLLSKVPLNTRALWGFVSLTPGMNQQQGGVVRFAGSRVNQNAWSMDGTSFADGVDNTATGPLLNYIESFQEAKIDLANNSAEFSSLGQVNIISKSGTNAVHGSAFDYYVTPMFRAADPFSFSRGTGIMHYPGGTIGGPAFLPKLYDGRNRTFFFFDFEKISGSQRTQNLNPTVPLPAWRDGDFSGLATTIYDPQSGQPFPGNRIPAGRMNPVSKAIQERFYPLPNYGSSTVLQTQNFRQSVSRSYDPTTFWATRIDHRFSQSDSLFGRYTWQRNYNLQYDGNLPTIGQRYQQRNNRAATVSYTHLFGVNKVNEIRWGYSLNNNPIFPAVNGPQLVQSLGLVGLAPNLPDIPGILKIAWSGLALAPIAQPDYTNPGYRTHSQDVQEHFSWFVGRHSLKFGYNLYRSEYDDFTADPSLFGNLTFSNRFTNGGKTGQGSPYADFLLGIPTTAQRGFPSLQNERNRWSHDLYALDDFKISAKVTLNIGIRWEAHLPWRENHDQMAIFDIASGGIVVPDGALSRVSPILPKNYVNIAEASSVGLPSRTLIRAPWHNFAPRIGLAWRPSGNNTVVRAGFGIFYDVVPIVYALSFGGSPFTVAEPPFTNDANNPQVILPRVFPATGTGGPSTVSLPAAQNPDLRTPYSLQYNFTIERQQWNTGFRISYIGTAMRQGAYRYNYNSPIPDARPYTAKARPYPRYPDVFYVTNGVGHQYNGLTVEAMRQMAKGLYFQASWTWARDRYDLDYNWGFADNAFTPENPFDRRREIGPAQEIPKFRYSSNWIYQLPFGRGRYFASGASRLLNLVVGGWEMSGVYSAQTGQYLTPLWSGPDPVGIAYTTSSPANVLRRPDILSNPNLPHDQRSLRRWFDTSAFAPPKQGQFGTSAKGVILGSGTNVWHMGLAKEFQFNDRGARLRWEITAVNVFNHPNWANPGVTVSNASSFGVITAVGVNNTAAGDVNGVRAFRTGLRMVW